MSKGGKITTSGEKINVIKLDDIKINNEKKIKGIKIDTEGEDCNVLLEAENTIRLFKPEIIIETRKINKYKIFESLSKYGYKFCLISNELIPVDL